MQLFFDIITITQYPELIVVVGIVVDDDDKDDKDKNGKCKMQKQIINIKNQ